jgi:uncharacterized membrane protein YsdA (DUF1294 family)
MFAVGYWWERLALLAVCVLCALAVGLGWPPLWAYLASINVVTLLYYKIDKRRAVRGSRRIPESVFHGLHVFGGTPGGLAGQLISRHKTRKPSFQRAFWLIVILQAAAVIAWFALR